jgi:hypothetical protein
MSQLLHRETERTAGAVGRPEALPTGLRPVAIAVVVTVALLLGIASGWGAFTALSGPAVEDIQRARAEAQADYHEQVWRSRVRPQEIERARAEAMVDHYERRWRDRSATDAR